MLFDIQVEDFPNAFARVDFRPCSLNEREATMAEEKATRTPRAVSVAPAAINKLVDWQDFMTGAGFSVTEIRIAGNDVVEGVGEKNGKTHIITPELRALMNGHAES